jgi:hypothetical protein
MSFLDGRTGALVRSESGGIVAPDNDGEICSATQFTGGGAGVRFTALAEEVGLHSVGPCGFGAAHRCGGHLSQRRLIHFVAPAPGAGTFDSHRHIEDARAESLRLDEFGSNAVKFLRGNVFEWAVLVLVATCGLPV